MPDLKITLDYTVLSPRKQAMFAIPESDWKRIHRLVDSMSPESDAFLNWGFLCLGSAANAGFSLLAFGATASVPGWAIPTTASILAISIGLGFGLLILHRVKNGITVSSKAAILQEMDAIEAAYELRLATDDQQVPEPAVDVRGSGRSPTTSRA